MEHRQFHRGGRGARPGAIGVAGALLLSLTQLGQPATAAAPAPGGTCVLTPLLRDYTINQGVGSTASTAANYNPLTRGKETEVRLYLSKPSCATATSGQAISLTGATLTMSIPGSASKTYSTLNPVSSASPAPLVLYTGAPAPDSSGDPKFVIPGPDLLSADPATRFTPTFTATITYSTSAAATNPALTFSGVSGTAGTIAATVEQRTKALRVLVVPMAAGLTSTDNSTLQAGLNSLSRMLPVPKAGGQLTGPLSSTSNVGGIRYAINAGVASVPLDATTRKYCGDLSNFDPLKTQLAQFRNDWNAANSANTTNPDLNPTADVVVGVISDTSSLGSAAGCADGVASTNSPVAWVRLVPPTTTPSTAGNLMAMEIAHTFNAEGSWGDPFSPTHSANTQADAATNRAYNITTRSFLSDDRTTMKSQATGWNQDSTVYEQRDFNFLTCRLGGQTNADCATTGTVGTVNGVANGPTFVLSGTTDNTPAGTHIIESFNKDDIAFTPLLASSPYRVEFIQGQTVVRTRYVDVPFATSVHSSSPTTSSFTAPTGLITLAVPFEVGSKKFQFVYDPTPAADPSDDVVLFSSVENGKPKLRDFTIAGGPGGGTFVNYTATDNRQNIPSGDDRDPALSQDGKWIAWVGDADGRAVEVASTSDIFRTDVHFSAENYPAHPSWSPDGRALTFAGRDGDIYTVPVDTTSANAPVIGQETKIYDGGDVSSPNLTNEVLRSPTLSVSGTCNPAGSSTFTFDSSGTAYNTVPGTYTESGSFTIGPFTPGDPYAGKGKISAFSASFTITPSSPDFGPITGTKTLNPLVPDQVVGSCTGPNAADVGLPPSQDLRVVYDAQIPYKGCTYRETGAGDFDVTTGPPADFSETYRSGQTTGCLPRAANPSFSPDGGSIAFDDGNQVYTMKSDGKSITKITPDSGSAVSPSWSQTPGDSRIAFSGIEASGANNQGIYAIAPDGAGGPVLLNSGRNSGTQPSWGTDGLLAYNDGGVIRVIDTSQPPAPPPSSGPTPPPIFGPVTVAASSSPPAIDGQLGSAPAYVRRGVSAFVRQFPTGGERAQSDVMLERPGLSFSATAGIDGGSTDAASLNNLRLTLYYQCPGSPERSVLGLAFSPTSIQPAADGTGTARFAPTITQTQLCGGSGGGVVTAVLTDFFTSAPFPGQVGFDPPVQNKDIARAPQGPTAAIVDPVDGSTFFDWESIALQGEGSSAFLQQLPDPNLTWTVSGAGLPSPRSATGSTVDLARLPAGDYTLALRATDPATGQTDDTSRLIHVIADSDRDGLSDAFEASQSCFPVGAATNGDSINLDTDGDGIPDGQDAAPCTAATAYGPTVIFNPDTLYVPSSGNSVTMYVQQDHSTPDLQSLVGGSVRIVAIRGIPLGGASPVTFQVTDQQFSANRGWSVSGTPGKDQLGTAKFDRQPLNTFIKNTFKLPQQLTLTLRGYSSVPAWTFSGSGVTTAKKG